MEIEQFVALSEGEWRSMRSSHSLAFQQFEEVISRIAIKKLNTNNEKVIKLLEDSDFSDEKPISPFQIEWVAESNWESENEDKKLSGSSILIPVSKEIIVRSVGYAEETECLSKYKFLSDGTLTLFTRYHETIAEERIWFISKNVRCRSSVIRSSQSKAILQTSFASEVRKINL